MAVKRQVFHVHYTQWILLDFICLTGTCVCQEGFYDIDCRQDEHEPPYDIGIPDNGTCDIQERDCVVSSVGPIVCGIV